jgi:hypothetical protein
MSIGVFVISCVKITYLHVANTQTVWGGCDSLLMKGLLLNTWYVLVDVLIAVRLHYRLSEAAVILYIISYFTCQLNLPLTVWSGCDCSWILLHRYMLTNVAWVQFYYCVLIFQFLLCFHSTFQWHMLCGTCTCCSLNGDTSHKMRF